MRRSNYSILFSFFLLVMVFVTIFADFVGFFSYSDVPFLTAFFLYFLFLFIQKGTGKTSFVMALFLLVFMGLSYIPTGAGRITERMGEWLYLFFIVGLIQSIKEAWKEPQTSTQQYISSNWDAYYTYLTEHDKRIPADTQLDLHARWYENWLSYIEKHVHIFDTSLSSFEIGSGMGGALRLLSSFGVPITGSDISPKAMHTFRNKYRTIPYIVYNVEHLFLKREKYDQVFAFEILEHIKNPLVAIKNIKKLLKKNGHFVGTTPYPYGHAISAPTHCSVHPPSYWEEQFKKEGFSSVQTYPMSLPPYLWRIHPKLNVVFPFYIPFRSWISTILIVARA